MHLVGIVGSFRQQSVNLKIMKLIESMLPEGTTLEILNYQDIPLYNGDIAAQGFPESVQTFAEAIRESDGVIIAFPEYNYSIPGVLKNAIDWISRMKSDQQPLSAKPVALISGAGQYGGIRGQNHMRAVLHSCNAYVLNHPQVMIKKAQVKFDDEGNVLDDTIISEIEGLLAAFERWIETTQDAVATYR